jgi:hypothetical protein
MNTRIVVFLRSAVLVALLAPILAMAQGTVVAVDGKAELARGSQTMPAVDALEVRPGDTLNVSAQSKVELQLADDSVFAIPGAATLRIDEFRMPTAQAGGKAVYTLVEGGFRTVTGRVGKSTKDEYAVNTDLATITVRGSAYTAMRCRVSCKGAKAGLYVRAESGVITVGNGAGRLVLQPGQVAFVEAKDAAPKLVQNSPFNDPIFASAFDFSDRIETTNEPPRIEQENPASPS